jgi:hypothetical protein
MNHVNWHDYIANTCDADRSIDIHLYCSSRLSQQIVRQHLSRKSDPRLGKLGRCAPKGVPQQIAPDVPIKTIMLKFVLVAPKALVT